MKRKLLLLAVPAFLFVGYNVTRAQDPTPVYFNDFSSTTGLIQVGTGEFITDDDARFGQIYHNNPYGDTSPRTNYLKLPTNVLTYSGTSNAMTIGFWVNRKATESYFYCPLFSAYGSTTPDNDNGTPMFICQTRCLLQINDGAGNWSDFLNAQNDNGTDNETTTWLDDNKWHYYTMTLTPTKAIVYVDGSIINSWTLDGTTNGQVLTGLFTNLANGTYPEVCLGGNQAWGWADKDPSFGFDDFAVYDAALSAAQIAQIMANKLHYTVNAVDGSSNVLKVLADANSNTNTVDVAYPRYILDGSTLREAEETSGKYTKTYTLTNGNQVENIAYDYSSIPNVYYYAEGEDVLTNNRTYEGQSLSMNKIGYTTNSSTYVSLITLPAGTWTIKARYLCGNKTGAHNAYIKVGDEVKWSQEYADQAGGNAEKASAEFTLTAPAVLSVAADGGSVTGFDWLYVSGSPNYTVIGETDNSTYYLEAMTDKIILAPGQSWHYKFVNYNSGSGGNHNNWVLPVYNSSDDNKIVVRSDFWEDNDKGEGHEWGNNAGCTATIVWDGYVANMNGAEVDMTVTFTADKKFTMSSIISPSDGSDDWTYSYTSNYTGTPYDFTSDNYIKVALSISNSWLGLIEEGPSVPVGSIGWATHYTPYAIDFSSTGLTAYTAELSGSTVTLTEVSNVPANTGVVLKGDEGSYNIPTIASSSTEQGDLIGSSTTSTAYDADPGYTYYILSSVNGGQGVQFNPVTSGTIAAGKAFLKVSAGAAKAFTVVFADPLDAVKEIREGQSTYFDEHIYNIMGQKLNNAQKGINIINGKKIFVK